MANCVSGKQRRMLLARAALRGAGTVRPSGSAFLRMEGLESRVMLAAAPVITAPQIFGVRPGSPFLFDVTAIGDSPMTFSAVGLPAGLTLNPTTGMITGNLANYATYDLTLTATNPVGSTQQNFRIVVGDKISLTPALGWNSWTIFGGTVTDAQVRAQAAAIASSGLINYGWTYVNIDAGWEGGRTAQGQPITGNPSTFPNMQALGDYIHSLNLKFGVYTVPQWVGYVGEPAGTTDISIWPDAQRFAQWGVDYVKYDGDPPSQSDTMELSEALKASGRDMILSLSNFGGLPATSGDFYTKWTTNVRVGADITDEFHSILSDGIDLMQPWLNYIGPGHWGDPDNLLLGVVIGHTTTPHPTNLTHDQQVSQMSIWTMDAAPLLMGNDLTKLDPFTLGLLTNPEVLAVDQDPLGIPSRPVGSNTLLQSRPLADGSTAVELINVSDNPANITVNFSSLGLTGAQVVRDLWARQDKGSFSNSFTATVPADGTVLIRIKPAGAGAAQITGQPINQYVDAGKPATFTVAATGTGTLAYQWTRNGSPIAGANAATYTMLSAGAADDGASYRCIVSNGVGTVISYEATLSVRGTTYFLSDSKYFFGTTGYYTIQMDKAVTGVPMTIGGLPYAKGIGTHSPSEIDYLLAGKGGLFQADVGIDANQPGLAIFQVWLDGVKVFDSGVLTGGQAPVPVSLDVRGARVMQLLVVNGGPNNNYAQADWGNARVTTALTPLALPTVSSFSRTTTFNTALGFTAGDFTAAFNDPNAGQTLQSVKISTLPAHGTLKLSGSAVLAGQNILAGQVGNLAYTPASGYFGADSFGWTATDQIGFALAPAQVNLSVLPPPPPNAPPLSPLLLAAVTGTSSAAMSLTWSDASATPNVPTGYTILSSTDGVHFNTAATASAGATTVGISGLAAGTTYFFEVVGSNTIGNSAPSNVVSGITTAPAIIASSPSTSFNLASGFTGMGSLLTFNGTTKITSNYLSLTSNQTSQKGSVFFNTQQNITNFTTQFDFQVTGTWPLADGFTFVIQNTGLTALGAGGGGLGYGAATTGGTGGIGKSVAIKFDFFSNQGEGVNSTGLYINGAAPTNTNSIDLGSTGFNMRSYDPSRVLMNYDGTTLTVLMRDLVTNATASQSYAVNIPSIVGGTAAWVGFTAADGSIVSYQNILNWTYSGSAPGLAAPAAPAGLTVIPVAGQAMVSWTAAASASSYTLKYSTTPGGPYISTIANIAGTATTVSGLNPGSTYYFVLSATNPAGEGANSAQVAATLAPAAPTGVAGVGGNGQVTLNWNAAAGASSYTVKYGTNSGGPYTGSVSGIAGTSTTATGLTNNVPYYFVVTATNAGGESPNSVQAVAMPVLPLPAAPLGLSATPGNGQVVVSWNSVTYADSYTIKYGTTPGGPYAGTMAGIAGTSATVTGLTKGAAYYFVVSATNATGEGTNSAQASALLIPPVPTGLNAVAGANQATVTWGAASGASFYTLRYGTSSGGPYTNSVTNLVGTSTTVTGLAPGATYYFVLSASNASGESGNTGQSGVTLVPGVPTGVVLTPGNGQLGVTWNSVAGATSYVVRYGTSAGGPYTVVPISGTGTTLTGLASGTTYFVLVSAANSAGEGVVSAATSATLVPAPPSGLVATPGNGQIALSWSPAVGATSYTVKYATTSGGPYTNVSAVGAAITLTGLASGTTYYFVVSASNGSGESANTSESSATLIPPTPTGIVATPGKGQLGLSWNAAVGAASYTVKYATVSGGPYTSVSVAGTSTTLAGLASGTTYYYVVSASNASGESANSAQSSTLLVPAAPTGLVATPGNGQLALNWLGVFGATSYTVKYATTSGGPYTSISVGGTSTTLTGLANGATYYFVVSASNATGEGDTSSQGSATLVPVVPAGLSATAGNGQAALSWSAASGVTSYTVKYGTVSGGPYGTIVSGIAGNGTTISGLTNGTAYYFVVSASNGAGESGNSGQASATLAPLAPSSLTVTSGNAQAALSWSAVAGATAYTIKYGTSSGGPYLTTIASASTSATVSNLTNGALYYFVVSASNAGGESPNSSQGIAQPQVPPPAVPTGLVATPGNAQVALSWTAVAAASGYTIKYGTVNGGPYVGTLAVAGNGGTVSGLTNGTTYYFVVTASNAGGESGNSVQTSAAPALPIPGAPAGLTATAGNGQVALSWTGVAGATGYTIKYATTSGGPYTTTIAAAGTSATVSGLANGTTYYFVVSANSAGGASANSSQANARPLPPLPASPGVLTTTAGNGQVVLAWNAVSGATTYTVKYGTTSGGPYSTTVAAATNGATITGLTNGTAYYFVVTASNLAGESGTSTQSAATPVAPVIPPAAPTGLTANAGNGQVAVSWNAVGGATSYALKYGTTSGGPYLTTVNVAGTSTTVTGLGNGTAYYFVVTATTATGTSVNSSQASATPAAPALPLTSLDFSGGFASAAPVLQLNGNALLSGGNLVLTSNVTSQISSVYAKTQQNITAFSTQFDFQLNGTWPLGDGFTFVIQRAGVNAIGQGGGGLGYAGIGSSVAIKFDEFGNQGEGNNSTGLYTNGAMPTSAGSIDLGNTSFNMRSYNLSRATMTYDGTKLTVVLKDLVTGATATQNYLVNIPAVIGGSTAWVGFTAASGALMSYQKIVNWTYAAMATAAPGVPGIPTAVAGNGSVALSWSAVSGAITYSVKYAPTSGGPYTNVTGISSTSVTVSGLNNATTYYFVVSAVNGAGESGNSTEVAAAPVAPVVPAPSAPVNLTVTPGSGQVALAWAASAGATSYTIKYGAVSGGPYANTLTASGTSTTLGGLVNGTTYYFVVSASNSGGESANSTQAAATPNSASTTIPYAAGIPASGSNITLNGAAFLNAGNLLLTQNKASQVASAYFSTQQNITSFTTQFDFQITGSWPLGDGFTFVIQRAGVNAIGQSGGGLGYGATTAGPGIANSVAIKFDVFSNSGEGTNSTGLYVNGATPTNAGSINLDGTGFNLRSYNAVRATITCNGTTLTVTLKDLVNGTTATQNYLVNIPSLIGGNTAWVGFTAASGSQVSNQNILNWTYTSP